jgi:hypothetical protein
MKICGKATVTAAGLSGGTHLFVAQLQQEGAVVGANRSRHRMVDLVVDQAEHVGGGVQDHLSGEGPARPVLLVPPVDVLQLVLHRVDRCAVALAEGVQSDALRLVHRTAGLLEGEDCVGGLRVEDAPQGDVVLVVQVDGVVATIVYDLQKTRENTDNPQTKLYSALYTDSFQFQTVT